MSERWTADSAPIEAYDRSQEQLHRAEKLLAEIRNGKHSLPGVLVQIDRYFGERGHGLRSNPPGHHSGPSTPKEDSEGPHQGHKKEQK